VTQILQLLVGVYGLFTLIMLVVRFERGLILLVPIVPLTTYAYRSPITGLNLNNLLIYTAFSMGLLRRMGQRGPLPPATWPIITFFTFTLFSWLIGWLNYRNNSWYPYETWNWFINIERWVVYALLYFAYSFGWSPRIPVRRAFAWMLAGFFIVAAYNLIEAAWPSQYLVISGRAGGLFGQANSNGIFLASFGLLPLVFASTTRSAARRVLYWGIFVLGVYGTLFSASRTGLICLVAGLLLFTFYRSKRAFAAMAVTLCLLVPLGPLLLPKLVLERFESTVGGSEYEGFAGEFEGSTANRLVQYQAGLKLFMESPIIGQGLGGFYYRSPKYLPPGAPEVARSSHSAFLTMGVDGGILTLAGFLWLLASLARAGKRLYEEGPDEETRLLGLFLLVSMASKILANFASLEFVTGDVTAYVWISAALVSRLQGQVGVRSRVVTRPVARPAWQPRAGPEVRPPVMHG